MKGHQVNIMQPIKFLETKKFCHFESALAENQYIKWHTDIWTHKEYPQ